MIELPRRILIGNDILDKLGSFIIELVNAEKVAIVTGPNVIKRLSMICNRSLDACKIEYNWFIANAVDKSSVEAMKKEISKDVGAIIGFGGGRPVDVAKTIAYELDKPFISVPTSASHDGIASPFSSIRTENRPYSIVTRMPIGVLADIRVISEAPRRLLASGCGDLIAKLTAVKDWELGRDERGE